MQDTRATGSPEANERHQVQKRGRLRSHRALAASRLASRRRSESADARCWRAIFEHAPNAILVTDRDGCIQFVNGQVETVFGYPREELLGRPVEMLIPERLHVMRQQHCAGCAAAPVAPALGADLCVFAQRRDGSEFRIEVTLTPLDDEEIGSRIVHSIRDVSELQRAQTANQDLRRLLAVTDPALDHLELDDLLPELLDRVRDVVEVDAIVVWSLPPHGRELWVRAISGPGEDVAPVGTRAPIGEGLAGRVAASREPIVVDDLATSPATPACMGQRTRAFAGVPLILGGRILGVLQVGALRLHHFTDQDIELLQRAAERIAHAIERAQYFRAERRTRRVARSALARARASETQLQRLAEAGIIGIVVSDGERVTEANDAFLTLVGYSREDVQAGTLTQQALLGADPELRAASERAMQQALRTGGCEPFECEYVRKDGSRAPVLLGTALLQKFPPLFVSFVVDLSERKQLERVAAEHAAQLAAVFHAIKDGIVVFDLKGMAVLVNEAEARINGFVSAAAMQRSLAYYAGVYELTELDGRVLPVEEWPVSRALRGESLADRVLRGRRRDTGQEWVFSFSAEPVRDAHGRQILAVVVTHDVTERTRLAQTALERERLYHSAFEQAAVGMARVSPTGEWLEVNERLCRIVGYSREDLMARTFQDITYSRDLPTDLEGMRRMLSGESERYAMEKRYVRKDGSLVWVQVTVALARDPDGKPQYFISVIEDISARKRLELAMLERERLYHANFEQAAVGMARVSPTGEFLEVNRRLCEITGYSREDLMARTFQDITYPNDLPTDLEYVRQTLAGERNSYTIEKRYVRKDGSLVWVQLTVALVRDADGEPQYYVSVIEDISARKQAEAERRRMKREREEARSSELASRQVAQHLDEFFKAAAHDIRSPVGVLIGHLDIALRRFDRLRTTAHGRHTTADLDERLTALSASLAEANASADTLTRLVVRLFDVARARAGILQLELARCDLAALVREQVEAYRLLAPDRIIDLEIPDESVMVVADTDRLGQVIANFLSNAIKYSPKEAPVTVGLEVDDGRARMWVRDEGPGLAKKEQRRIWEPIYRAAGVETQSHVGPAGESLGLGLHICRAIVEKHPNGQVGVKSKVGQGSTFWFSLPVTQ